MTRLRWIWATATSISQGPQGARSQRKGWKGMYRRHPWAPIVTYAPKGARRARVVVRWRSLEALPSLSYRQVPDEVPSDVRGQRRRAACEKPAAQQEGEGGMEVGAKLVERLPVFSPHCSRAPDVEPCSG